jgi:hypothetical protein
MKQEQGSRRTKNGMVVYLHGESTQDIMRRKKYAGDPDPSAVTYKDLNRYEIREENHTKRI